MVIRDDTYFRSPDHVLLRTAGAETVLLNRDTEEFFGLDGVGARAFELLERPRAFGDLVRLLLEEYDVPRNILERDLRDLLGDLAGLGLVVVGQ